MPAAAVIRRGQALSGFTGCKGSVDGFASGTQIFTIICHAFTPSIFADSLIALGWFLKKFINKITLYTGTADGITSAQMLSINFVALITKYHGTKLAPNNIQKIDGVNAWQMMVKICVPLAKPALATVTLFSIVGHWNNFFDGLLLINNPDKVPLQTYIQSLVVKLSEASNMSSSELIQVMSQRTFNAAKIVASTIPILVIYPFMQKYFVTGLTLGSVKE